MLMRVDPNIESRKKNTPERARCGNPAEISPTKVLDPAAPVHKWYAYSTRETRRCMCKDYGVGKLYT